MINLHVTDTDGSQKDISCKTSRSGNLMEILVKEGFDVMAICGGMAGCGTCHISVEKGSDKLDPPEGEEEFMLDTLPNLRETSRLACQISLTDALNGAEIEVLGDGA